MTPHARARRLVPTVLALGVGGAALAGCAADPGPTQGVLQPQATRGPCTVDRFFLLGLTTVHTDMAVSNSGQSCGFVVLNPDLQIFPTASLITRPPLHGRAEAGFTNGGRSPVIAYTPAPGYVGPDRFVATIEPNAHGIEVRVSVR